MELFQCRKWNPKVENDFGKEIFCLQRRFFFQWASFIFHFQYLSFWMSFLCERRNTHTVGSSLSFSLSCTRIHAHTHTHTHTHLCAFTHTLTHTHYPISLSFSLLIQSPIAENTNTTHRRHRQQLQHTRARSHKVFFPFRKKVPQ